VQDEHVDLIVIVIEQSAIHHYQPGYLFIPFGVYTPEEIQKPVEDFIPQEAILMAEAIERIDPDADAVLLSSGKQVFYDVLIIATGNHIAPEETEGMMGPLWHKDIFDFYTLEGAIALRDKLQSWNGVKLFLAILRMPSGYYDFLRVAVTIGAVIAIVAELKTGLSGWVTAFAILAVLFNPIEPIYRYKKSTWALVDAIAGLTFLLKAWLQAARQSKS
jgi:hypothetical protein